MRREMHRLTHQPMYFVLMVVLPVVSFAFFALLFNKGAIRNIPIAVLDEDHTTLSRKVAQMIDDTPTAMVAYDIQSMDEGERLMREGRIMAIVQIPAFFEKNTTRKNDVVAVAVHLDDAGLDAGAHVGGEVLDATEVDEGSGQEATQADVEDQAALDNLDNLALDVLAGVELLLDAVPSTLVLGTLLGQDQTTVLVLLLENEGLDGITECNDVCRVSVLADGQLAGRGDALALEADVHQHLVVLHLNDSAVNEIALIKVGNRTVDEVVHLLLVDIVKRENGRVLNLTQRWTPFELRGPDC